MDEEIIIIYNNKSEKIIKFNSESNKRFNERINFIRLLEKKNIKWKNANKLSKIWSNIKYLNCKYNPSLYKLYLEFDKLLNK
jgi:hypothetical protein